MALNFNVLLLQNISILFYLFILLASPTHKNKDINKDICIACHEDCTGLHFSPKILIFVESTTVAKPSVHLYVLCAQNLALLHLKQIKHLPFTAPCIALS